MTLRDYLNRRSIKASLVMAALIAGSWIYASKQGWDGTAKTVAGVIGVAAVALSLFIMRRTRCPKCGQLIGYIDGSRKRRMKSFIGLDHCRNCGLHLDEEIGNLKRD